MVSSNSLVYWVLDSRSLAGVPIGAKPLSFTTHSLVSDPGVEQRKPSHRVTVSMEHTGASRKSPNDAPWETLRQASTGQFLQTPDPGQDFFFLSAIVCPWLNFGLPPRCPQVVWCLWGEIEPFSATLAQDGLAECDQPGKIPWNTPPWLGIEPGPRGGQTVSYPTELSWLTGYKRKRLNKQQKFFSSQDCIDYWWNCMR